METTTERLLRPCLALLLTLSCIGAQAVTCDFEDAADPLCGFSNVAKDDGDFQFQRSAGDGRSSPGSTPAAADFKPASDHTYRNATGHFLNADVSGASGGQFSVAKAYSPAVTTPTGTARACLQFAYRQMGQSVDSLLVYRDAGSRLRPVFNVTGSLGPDWRVTTMEVVVPTGTTSIRFMFAAIIVMSGNIAIDDIKVSLGECAVEAFEATTMPPTTATITEMPPLASYDCTFDDPGHSDCAPRMDAGNDFDWMFRQAGIRPNNQAPVYDHTTSTSAGLYLYVPQDGGQTSSEETGTFRTATLQITFQPKCLEFYYYMRGSQVGTLNVYTGRPGDASPLPPFTAWNRTGDQGGYWTRGLLDIHPAFSDYEIIFEAKRSRDYRGCIAVDDLRLMDGRCPREEVKCDFESLHACYFTQDRTTDDMDWVLGNGNTPSFGTGPSNDHTYGNSSGFYMFIETSSPVASGHVARLLSPPLTETHGHAHCLIFWYHMYGQHVDTLSVHMANATTPTLRRRLWSLSGNRGNKWRAAEVHVTSAQDFLIIFEATRGPSYQGDISIDDVWVTSTEGCPGEAGLKNYSSITCDFEEVEICYWAQDSSDDFDWTWQSAADHDKDNTGPSGDHTTGSPLGFYMYIAENYQTFPGGTARIWSPVASAQPAKSCLEFYYHMFGRDIETLNVYMAKSDDGPLGDAVWSMTGNQGRYWHRATVDIPVTDYTFRFVMEGTRGESYRDNIAFDDVKFYEGQNCPIVTTQAPIPTTVPNPVASADCDFENEDRPLCGYTQSIYDDLDWSEGSADPSSSQNMARTAKGKYLFLDFRSYPKEDDRAELYSPLLSKTEQPRCLEFSFYLTGSNPDFLMVYLTQWGATLSLDPFYSLYGDQGDQWNVARVDIPPMDTNFQVVFMGTLTFFSYIGIDDIKFTPGACPIVTTTPMPTDGHCDFEQGYKACGYEHARADFVWRKHSGQTASQGTGPSVDHTTGTENGQFMYVEASLPQRPNQRARLQTPYLQHAQGTPFCMLFYYHMNGEDVGQIKVYAQTKTETKSLLTLGGNSKDVWQPAAVDLSNAGVRFRIIFEGVVGYGVAGDMAIDDVSVRREPCPGFAKTASVDFEMPGELNGFHQMSLGGTNWIWYDQYTETRSTLPEQLVAGDGSFMYVNGSKSKPESSASILSPIMAGHASAHCVDYDYALYGDSELRVSIGQKSGLGYDLTSWAGATAWRHERRTLTKAEVGEDFAIVFTGVVGSQGNGYVAVDNLVIRDDSCDELSKPGEPAAQVSSGSATAAIVLFVVLLLFVVAATTAGAVWYYRQRQQAKGIPPVLYSNKGERSEGGDNAGGGALSKDFSIANPNYDHAVLHSSA